MKTTTKIDPAVLKECHERLRSGASWAEAQELTGATPSMLRTAFVRNGWNTKFDTNKPTVRWHSSLSLQCLRMPFPLTLEASDA